MRSNSRRTGLGLVALLLGASALALGACASDEQQTSAAAAGRPCYVEGVDDRAECHTISVPEDWSNPSGRKVDLHVAVLPATGTNKDGSALFVLAGGPGQAATHYGDLVSQALDRVRSTRPIILMDQRGTGSSNGLRCAFGGTTLAEVQAQSSAEQLQRCRRGWKDTALQHYTTPDVIKDVEAVRGKLGFDKLDLWGASWGTRTALLYMREFPQRVRSAVLDGVTGPNTPLFFGEARYAQEALDKLFADCAADAQCNKAFPNLRQRALARLDQEGPQTLEYIGRDGRRTSMTLEPDMLRQVVRGALYSPEGAARLPYALHHLLEGDATPILAIADSSTGFIRETMYHGSTFSSLCAEELPRVNGAALEKASAGSFAKDSFFKGWAEGCKDWPRKPLPSGYAQPVTANVPVLLLSGALDPITPPEAAELVKAHLPRAWHIVAPASGHNVTTMDCAGKVISRFIGQADGGDLDASCLTKPKRPPFMVSPLGPKA